MFRRLTTETKQRTVREWAGVEVAVVVGNVGPGNLGPADLRVPPAVVGLADRGPEVVILAPVGDDVSGTWVRRTQGAGARCSVSPGRQPKDQNVAARHTVEVAKR